MIIPTVVRVGSTFYKVTTQDTPVVVNGLQCYGYCDPNNHTIILATDIQDEQTMEQTFCHELVHAMMFERKVNLEAMGLTNAQMEHVVDSLGISLHQILLDNPDITLTDEEYDAKYPLDGDETDVKQPKLSKEKNCIKCLYHKEKSCKVDGHNIMIDLLRAYSCKYYKELYIIKGDDDIE